MIEPSVGSADTYPMPAHGWTCFHCGETFRTPGSARIHFGTTPASTPGCVIKAGDEKGLLMALRKAEDARDEFLRQRQRSDEDAEVAHRKLAEVLQLCKGAKGPHDVWCHLESLEGRVLAAEATLAEVGRIDPQLLQRAIDRACQPAAPADVA